MILHHYRVWKYFVIHQNHQYFNNIPIFLDILPRDQFKNEFSLIFIIFHNLIKITFGNLVIFVKSRNSVEYFVYFL